LNTSLSQQATWRSLSSKAPAIFDEVQMHHRLRAFAAAFAPKTRLWALLAEPGDEGARNSGIGDVCRGYVIEGD
jgi:hypothetical protein